ncbi:MAG: hypothetical protein AMXMBFR64_43750 [Myxococcales bacterium]
MRDTTRGLARLLALMAALGGCADDSDPAQDAGGAPLTDGASAADSATPNAGDTALATDSGSDVAADASDAGDATTLDTTDTSTPPDTSLTDPERLLAIPATETWTFEGLSAPVQVVRTEANVPHIYAATREDLAFAFGFVSARDRWFMMDLARRLGLGTLSELLGDAALETDMQVRLNGQRAIAEQTAATLSPELGAVFDAYAAGVNTYIERVKAGELPLATELELAGPLLGAANPADLMVPFDRLSLAGIIVVVQYEASFETGDVGRTATLNQLDGLFAGAPFEELRRTGARVDIWDHIEPIFPHASAPGLVGKQGTGPVAPLPPKSKSMSGAPAVPPELLQRLSARLERWIVPFRRDLDEGFGSNAWAVAGSSSSDGRSLLAGDGHLSLSVPSFLIQAGLDTSVLGGGDTHLLGLTIPGLPMVGLGTNGQVAWSHTQQSGDITDWYAEELQLADGLPAASRFKGAWHPLVAHEESYTVADIPLLGSEGGTVTVTRWTTFDGRWIAEVEGREAKKDEELAPGEALIDLGGDLIVPGDQDGDGKVSAISFDYTGLDSMGFAGAIDAMGHAADVGEFHEAMRGLNAYTQNFVASDQAGSIFYSGYQGVPCRSGLERDEQGRWVAGADPSFLLDGTKYGGFQVPMKDGKNDEAPGKADPSRCIVPFAAYPAETDPAQGFLANANNDPAGMTFDKDLSNDPWYIGGPFDAGIRMDTISGELKAAIAAGTADLDAMQRIQANARSRLGQMFAPYLVGAIQKARALTQVGGLLPEHEARLATLYESDAALTEVEQRLTTWAGLGYEARSGVETFYSKPAEGDADASVATMIFNAWIGAMMKRTFDDEGLPGVWRPGGNDGRIRTLLYMLDGRGPDNPRELASWHDETEESIFFDVLQTPELERSDEIMLLSLIEALDHLRSAPATSDTGGFGTTDMGKWLWGLRHQARFESILAEFFDAGSDYAFIADLFSIDTKKLPLAESLPAGDPRKGLRWFPRHGDQDAVDAANSGLNGKTFTHGSGPVMRMVVALGGGKVEGRNIIPGGQSGLTSSPHFHDQLVLWLANETLPMRFTVSEVAEGAIGREELLPAP